MADDNKAAQAKLDEAVQTFLRDSGIGREDMVTTGWVLVAHQAGWQDDEPISHHPILYMDGSLPDHIALGMLQIGADTVRGVGRWRRVEDEDE